MYTRRFLSDPGDAVLLNIESVNILDQTPPSSIQGVGTGSVLLVGEFENGPYNTPQQLLGTSDLARTWGTLGYQYGGLPAQYPSAPVRKADSAIAPEYWNGNAFVQISGQTYASLILVRVNTSIGAVAFDPCAYIEGIAEFSYQLTTGQVLQLSLSPYSTAVATAVALPAAIIYATSTTGFPSSGNITIDGQTIAYTGVTAGSKPSFTGCTGGTGSINVGDTVLGALTTTSATFTGVPATVDASGGTFPTTFAGGNTLTLAYDSNQNFTTTFQATDQSALQVAARINSFAGFAFVTVSGGQLVLTGRQPGTGGSVQVVGGSVGVLADLGLTAGVTAGTGNVGNLNQIKFAEIATVVQGAISGTAVQLNSSGAIRISNVGTPGTGGLLVAAGTTAQNLGFTIGQVNGAGAYQGGTLPAGTVVQNSAGTVVLVTTQDLVIPAGTAGPFSAPVRFAVDDGSGVGSASATITVMAVTPAIGSFACTNPLPISNAMSESQIDAAYSAAIQSTTDINTIAKVANIIVSARQSNTVRSQLKQNALYASANGCYGRVACVSPPLNTPPQVALSTIAAPGVGATSDQRVIYCYVGANTYVPLIGQVGLAGGTGFTATGNVDVHSDTLMASILSQLNPEENPGQETTFTANVNGIETGANLQGFDVQDYTAFKAAGIAALRIDEGIAVFQSGVTSVNPLMFPSLVRISRRRMADFIQDSSAIAAKKFGKKLSTAMRRNALKSEQSSFLEGLLSRNNPGAQRIGGYTISDVDGNSDTSLAAGQYRITQNVRTLASLDSITIQSTIGENVVVTEILPQKS
jgi:hypothetical protein